MTSVYATTDRLIAERLDALAAAVCVEGGAIPFARLVGAVVLLRDQHRIGATGRCRICIRRRRLHRRLARPCTVHSALGFFLTQPDELVLPELHAITDAESAMPC